MDRRAFLRRLGGGACIGLAGCASHRRATPATPRPGGVGRVAGTALPVAEHELRLGALRDAIPAITDPAFGEDWRGLTIEYKTAAEVHVSGTIEPRLEPGDRVLGVVRAGAARAYPLRVLNWHEVVNDTFAGPLLVTFCPLCGSGVVTERSLDGEATAFGVSGWLWNSDLVLYDVPTDSLWSQITATAIRGPHTGRQLEMIPTTLTTWSGWRAAYPDTEVLLPPPRSNTIRGPVAFDYTEDPYRDYATSHRMGIGQNRVPDHAADLHPKTEVLGIVAAGEATTYPLEVVRSAGAINDVVGGVPVVVALGRQPRTVVGYVRRVEDETLSFEAGDDGRLRAGGSRWEPVTGRAVDGPYDGTTLARASSTPQLFWFAWLDFHPDTRVYGR